MAGARRRLVHLAGLASRTLESERRILAAAEDRLRTVNGDMDRLRPRVLLDTGARDAYAALALERGQLETVAATARGHVYPGQ